MRWHDAADNEEYQGDGFIGTSMRMLLYEHSRGIERLWRKSRRSFIGIPHCSLVKGVLLPFAMNFRLRLAKIASHWWPSPRFDRRRRPNATSPDLASQILNSTALIC